MSEIAMSYFAALSTTSPSPHTEKFRLNQRPPLLLVYEICCSNQKVAFEPTSPIPRAMSYVAKLLNGLAISVDC